MMNLYIFENVLADWTSGMAVIAADSLDRALALATETCGEYYTLEEPGWKKPAAVYTNVDTAEGVKHICWGGA
jgi:hypothetical protein